MPRNGRQQSSVPLHVVRPAATAVHVTGPQVGTSALWSISIPRQTGISLPARNGTYWQWSSALGVVIAMRPAGPVYSTSLPALARHLG